jgi:hypothetical protein
MCDPLDLYASAPRRARTRDLPGREQQTVTAGGSTPLRAFRLVVEGFQPFGVFLLQQARIEAVKK